MSIQIQFDQANDMKTDEVYRLQKKKKKKNICFILLEYFSNVKFRIFSIVKVTLEDCKVTSHKNQKNDKYPLVLRSEYSILFGVQQ